MQKKTMKNNIYLVLGVLLLFGLLPVVSAVDFNKVFVSPFYKENLVKDTNYTYTLSINTDGHIEDVSSALVTFQLFVASAPQKFYLTINGQSCNNPYYISSTSGQANVVFECSNVFTQKGDYELILSSNRDGLSVIGWLDFYFSQVPSGELDVHGTEYTIGQTAKAWLQLLNGDGLSVEDGVCYVDIYTPDNEEYLEHALMDNMQHDGIYYYDLSTINMVEGVYPVVARCFYEAVSFPDNATNYSFYAGKVDGGLLSNTYLDNGIYFKIDTQKLEPIYTTERVDVNFTFGDFYSSCGAVSEELLSGISFYWKGKWNTGNSLHDINVYVYNYTSGAWIILPNEIEGGLGGDIQVSANSLDTNNVTTFLGINDINPMMVRFFDTDTGEGKKDWDTDRLYVSCDQLSNLEWQEVRGSSEFHISKPFNFTEFAETVWTYDNRTLTYYGDVANYSLIEDLIIQYANSDDTNYSLIEDLIVSYANDDTTNYSLLQNLIIEYANDDTTNYSLMEYLITQYSNEDTVNYTLINDLIIQYANDDTTNYSMIEYIVNNYNIDNTNYTLIQNLIDEYSNDDVTNYSLMEYLIIQYANEDNVNYSLVEDLIMQYASDETNYSLIEDLIMQYTNDETNYSLISDLIIQYANDDTTNYSLVQYLIANYGNDDATNYSLIEYIVENYNTDNTNYTLMEYIVANYGNEDTTNYTLMQFLITEYGNEDTINYTLIQELISQYANEDTINYTLIEQITSLYGNNDVTNYTLIENLLSQYAETDPTNYTLIQELISEYSLTASDVWNYNGSISTSLLDSISNSIWALFNFTYDFTTMIADAVWVFDERTLSDSAYENIAQYVWTSEDRNLTFYQVNDISVEDVWSYVNRSLTFYPEQEEINYSQIAEFVWLYADRNLTTEYINNISVEDIWTYYNRSLTQNLPLEIWSYENRDLTIDIPFEIWNYYNRTLTYYAINLTDLIDQINDYEFTEDVIIGGIGGDSITSNQLNVVLYVEK